jgi:DNA polymerase, archaea type
VATLDALRRRELRAYDVSSQVRLTKIPPEYRATRESRRELAYEAMLACGRTQWSVGDRVRVYRTRSGGGAVIDEDGEGWDRRDYDVYHYARVLRETFAARLERAFTEEDYEAVFADPEQMTLFGAELDGVKTVLRVGV